METRLTEITVNTGWLRAGLRLLLVLVALAAIGTCAPPRTLMQQIQTIGTLRMATVNSATTYYLSGQGPAGFEYDLARLWADKLGVTLEVVVVADRDAAVQAVLGGRAHFAAGLAVTPTRAEQLRLTPSYRDVTRQVVYRRGTTRPGDFQALDGRLTLPGDLAITDWLAREHPQIEFRRDPDANAEELLVRIARGKLDYSIAPADLVSLNQRYYPALRVAFELEEKAHLAWAFDPDTEQVLYNRAVAFIAGMADAPAMRRIVDRYFGHADRLGFVGGKAFARQVEERLPRWRGDFEAAGERLGFDWRLLAAIGYQESHWNPDAVSPTGVRGLMMLTTRTAREMKVDRLNPRQSIRGGARYLKALKQRMRAMNGHLSEPDLTWMALAAYNIGMGHLMDARRLVQSAGGDPDSWIDVRQTLPKLTQERHFSKTRYGYARGHEAVGYVGNIRAYYDILLWMTSDEDMAMPDSLTRPAPAETTPEEKALSIDVPTL